MTRKINAHNMTLEFSERDSREWVNRVQLALDFGRTVEWVDEHFAGCRSIRLGAETIFRRSSVREYLERLECGENGNPESE